MRDREYLCKGKFSSLALPVFEQKESSKSQETANSLAVNPSRVFPGDGRSIASPVSAVPSKVSFSVSLARLHNVQLSMLSPLFLLQACTDSACPAAGQLGGADVSRSVTRSGKGKGSQQRNADI